MDRYILVADEMGTPGMAPGTSDTFVFGGYVINEDDLPEVNAIWRKVKSELCGNPDAELKWKHFFIGPEHPLHGSNPLSVTSINERRQLAALALDHLFGSATINPVIAVSRKHKATDSFVVTSKKGKDKIDDDLMWLAPISLFAIFLSARQATGRLWMDKLGSEKHQNRRQEQWTERLRTIRDEKPPPRFGHHLPKLLAIEEHIEFLDSTQHDAIQVADLACGVIWQAGQGDEAFLARFVEQYGPNATQQGLGIIHIG